MKANNLREKTIEELKGLWVETLKEQFELRMNKAKNATVNIADFKKLRRRVARIQTIIKEKCSE